MKNGCPNQASKQLKPNGQVERMVKMTKKDQGERGKKSIKVNVCVCVCSAFLNLFFVIFYVDCFGRTMLYVCIEYHI